MNYKLLHSWLLLFAIISVNRADIGNVHTVLKYQLQECFDARHSVQSALSQLLSCIKSSVYRCLLFHEPLGKEYVIQKNGACGVINLGQQLRTGWWSITVQSKYGLSINFLHFHLPCFLTCAPTFVLLSIPAGMAVGQNYFERRYCGDQMPWNHSTTQSRADIIFFMKQQLLQGYYFVITFEAFDINTPSVGGLHELHYNPSSNFSSFLIARNIAFSLFDTDFHIYILVLAAKQVNVKYSTTPKHLHKGDHYKLWPNAIYRMKMFDVRVYDGPGILSPLVAPSCNSSTKDCAYYLSGYQGLLKYRVSVPSNFKSGYGWKFDQMDSNHSKEHGIIWSSKWVANSSRDCVYKGDSIYFHGNFGICWGDPLHSQITIHSMHFRGYNMHVDNEQPCIYGGLFILFFSEKELYYPKNHICMNVNSEIVFPAVTAGSSLRSSRVIIVFKSYKGYSDGSVAFTISQENDCIGWNYRKRLQCCRRCMWLNWKEEQNNQYQNNKCTEFWITDYAADSFNIPKLDQCKFDLKPALYKRSTIGVETKRPVGSFQLIVSSSAAYQHLTSSTFFTLTMDVDTLKDFPVDLSTENTLVSLKLQTKATQTLLFNAEDSLYVKLNYTGAFQQSMLSVRIQILENVICIPISGPHSFDLAPTYTLYSNISDVYLSRIHPYRGYLVKFMNYTGYNRGSCRVLIEGQTCSQNSSYNIIRIHHRPNMKLDAAH